MELRDIEIFLTLAEELHFGRTAERLRVSQARVSQAIRKQERRIGSPLFDRTSRRVELTPIGHKLRDDLRQAYDLIQGGLARAAAAGSGLHGTLRLGVMGALGNELRPVIEKFEARYAECDVLISEFHFSDPFGGLRTGEVDVQLMWLPIREPDLVHGPSLLTEGRVLAVAGTSPLADRASVTLEDLGDLVVLDPGTAVPAYWIESMLPQRTPQGRVIRRGQVARTFHEVLGHIAAGRLVSPLNAHVSRYYSYPGIRFVPIEDAPLTEWALVWPRASAADPILKAFVDTVQGG
ncbi:LysR family transcriptional regulator [Hamadaea flava]|uniref:LysR family transcriptional regulator n=1 Tax=Hamadaea flava TaxID=1742688 RepID=UPI0020A3C697|nr:LysR family transcriptional regulator [Hamadaea flava]